MTETLDLLGLLQERTSNKLRKAVTAYVVGQTVWSAAKQIRQHVESRITYQITISGVDEMYPAIMEHLLNLIPESKRRGIIASAVYSDGRSTSKNIVQDINSLPYVGDENAPASSKAIRSLKVGYDGSISQSIVLNGHKIKVVVDRSELSKNTQDEKFRAYLMQKEKVTFIALGAASRDAVAEWLAGIAHLEVGDERRPRFNIATRWGSWDRRSDTPLRTMDTVILANGQAEDIVADLTEFFANEEHYNRLGIPYHRGYLLHGPPRTGKTSIAKALANHFGMDMYYMPLGEMTSDADLLQMIASVTPRSMLLLEDIDTCKAASDRVADGADSLSMSALLNALDGVVTPHGMVVVMTTNHKEILDPALIGPGRCDRQFEINLLDAEQFSRLWAMFYECSPTDAPPMPPVKMSPAEVVEIFKHHIRDPQGARLALSKFPIGAAI